MGYWNRPELTGERFVPSPFRSGERFYKTGDLARYLSDGSIICLGRIDDQVKIHGVRVELGEVEAVLKNIAGVQDAVVTQWIDSRGDVQLAAHLIQKNGSELTGPDLRKHLRNILPDVMIPSNYLFHESFPLTHL